MKPISPDTLRLYAVTDRRWLTENESLASVVETLLSSGVTCVQLREKELPDAELLSEAHRLQQICTAHHVPLIINDRPDIARLCGAAGVHLGQSDTAISEARRLLGAKAIIGATAHSTAEALRAEEAGADYLGCGAVFGTSTKADTTALPLECLAEICQAVRIPVVAIGGITTENISLLQDTGIAGVAVVHALFAASDKDAAVKAFLTETMRLKKCTTENAAGSSDKR